MQFPLFHCFMKRWIELLYQERAMIEQDFLCPWTYLSKLSLAHWIQFLRQSINFSIRNLFKLFFIQSRVLKTTHVIILQFL